MFATKFFNLSLIPRPTWGKERTDSHKLSSDTHLHSSILTYRESIHVINCLKKAELLIMNHGLIEKSFNGLLIKSHSLGNLLDV